MDSQEMQRKMQLGTIKDTKEKETPKEEQLNNKENICYTCLFGAVLGISALAIGYLVLSTAVAYAIP